MIFAKVAIRRRFDMEPGAVQGVHGAAPPERPTPSEHGSVGLLGLVSYLLSPPLPLRIAYCIGARARHDSVDGIHHVLVSSSPKLARLNRESTGESKRMRFTGTVWSIGLSMLDDLPAQGSISLVR